MALSSKALSEILDFTRDSVGVVYDQLGEEVPVPVDTPRIGYDGVDLVNQKLFLDTDLGENAFVKAGEWYNHNAGTWLLEGEFDVGDVVEIDGYQLFGSGTVVVTYDLNTVELYGSGREVLTFARSADLSTPRLLVNGAGALKKAVYSPRKTLSADALLAAVGAVDSPELTLFKNSEIGAVLDSSRFVNQYQDSAGVTAVTAAGQSVGKTLDKSGLGYHSSQATETSRPTLRQLPVLGSNLAVNGYFDSDTTWVKGTGWTIANGVATKTAGTASTLTQAYAFTAGKTYEVTFNVTGATAGTVAATLTGGTTVSSTASGTNGKRTALVTTVTGNTSFGLTANANFNGYVDNYSIREVTGYHAGRHYLAYDGLDDARVVNFPSSLGSSCTVARAIPGYGHEIQTGVTIGTTFTDNVNNAELIILNREVTTAEVPGLAKLLDKRVKVDSSTRPKLELSFSEDAYRVEV